MKFSRIAFAALLVAGLLFSTTTSAQVAPAAPAAPAAHKLIDADVQVKYFTRLLTLTADQQSKLKPIIADRNQQVTALYNEASGDPKTTTSRWKAIMAEADTKILAILTDDQKPKYADWKVQQQQKTQKNNPAPATPPALPKGF